MGWTLVIFFIIIIFKYSDTLLPFVLGFAILALLGIIASEINDIRRRLLDWSLLSKYVTLKITRTHNDQQKIDKVKGLAELEKLGIKNKEISLDYAYEQSLISFDEITSSVESELSTFLNQGNFDIIKEEPVRRSFTLGHWNNELIEVITGSFIIKGKGHRIFDISIIVSPLGKNSSANKFSLGCQYNSNYSQESFDITPIIKTTKKCLIKYIKTHPEILS